MSSFKNNSEAITVDFIYLTYNGTGAELEEQISNAVGTDLSRTVVLITRAASGVPTLEEYSNNTTLLLPLRDLEGENIKEKYDNKLLTRFGNVGATYENQLGVSLVFNSPQIKELLFVGIHLSDNPYWVQNLAELKEPPPRLPTERDILPNDHLYLCYNINLLPNITNFNQDWLDKFYTNNINRKYKTISIHITPINSLIDSVNLAQATPPNISLGNLTNVDPNVDLLTGLEDGHELYWDNATNQWSHRPTPASGSRGFEYVFRTGLVVPAAGEVAYNNVALDTLRINKTDNQGISRAFYITPNINGSWEFQDNDPTTDNFFKISRKSESTFDAGTYLEWNNLTGTNLTLSDGDIVYLTIDNAGAQILNELDDVTITKVADQNILVYQQGTGQWQNQALPPTSETGSTVSAVFIPGSLPANNEFDLNFATGLFRLNQNNLFGTPQTYRRPSLGDLIHLTQQNGQGEMVVLRVTTDPILIGQYWEMTTNILKDDVFSSVVDNYTLLIVKEAVDQYIEITDPLVTSDVNGGYVVGDQWLNTTTDTVFICVDNTAGAAVWINISTGGIGRVGHPYNITDVVPNPPTTELPSGTVNLDDDVLYISSFDAKGVDIFQILNFAVTNQSIIQWFFNADSTKYFYVKVEPATLTFVPGVVEPGWFQGTVTVGEKQGGPVLDDEGTVLFNPVQHPELGQIGNVTINSALDRDYLMYDFTTNGWINSTFPMGSMYFRNNATATTITTQKTVLTDNSNFFSVAGVTIQKHGVEFTMTGNNVLRYDGTDTKHFHLVCQLSAICASNDRTCYFTIVKNGSTYDDVILSSNLHGSRDNGVALHTDVMLATNDTVSVYCANTENADNITVKFMYLFLIGM
jgi:hypothetical protein